MAYDADRAALLEALGGADLGHYGNASVFGGFPPGQRAIMSPETLRAETQAGTVDPSENPFAKLGAVLALQHGSQPSIRLSDHYASAATPGKPEVTSPFNITFGVRQT